MLPTTSELIAFVGATDPERAKAFYRDKLGLNLVSELSATLIFKTGETTLRISLVEEVTAAPYTVLGWKVEDIDGTVDTLSEKGVSFERIPGMDQDERGIWAASDGTKVAWFQDPDGNMLSVTEFTAR